ncbi:ABC transporter ATP-binding protein/permease [Kaistia geumhonensis]|uniref:ATP-binding cassette transporter n=1 Tax=Kaistia geumhonensis TaxID=410839 RepID=A0ABU0M8E9_9HYPH|nr:ABC transporter ATP-binding protein/permease [Kaistia geumhonensis]MCX5477711.1 ABC transporter ATP-binding protein/permease [Kaistia geumhonensis]MDQ0517080.1 putative ATP-binding cassette transporter [Kaistia geumhonensis]
MTERIEPNRAEPGEEVAEERPSETAELIRQFSDFVLALWRSSGRSTFILLTVGIVTVILATNAMQVALNAWNKPFYDAIEQKNIRSFITYLMVFGGIAGVLLALNVAQTWLDQMIKLQSRKWLTRDLIEQWLAPRRLVMIRNSGEIGVNPDQRVHEDARHLAELSAGLGIGLFQSSLLLASFIGVLWVLSSGIALTFNGTSIVIPGYMVWCALIYAATGSWLSWQVGRPLIGIGIERYAREADLRFAMVQVSENANGIALNAGEADEKNRLGEELERVLGVMRQLVGAIARLTWVTAGYGWVGIVAPIVIAAPGYFGGQLTFGQLMMVVGAFNQVQGSLRWFVDNFSAIADWRATLSRVMTFREALTSLEVRGRSGEHIAYANDGDHLALDNVRITWTDSGAELEPRTVDVRPGDRLQIIDGTGRGRGAFFSALAGLWPFGSGKISLPAGARTMFLPERPYMPDGTLRAAITYPASPSDFTDEQLNAALARVDLTRLASSLDRRSRWSRELSYDDEARLTFARLLLLKPDWIFTEQSIDTLDERQRRIFSSILDDELKQAALVTVAGRGSTSDFYNRTADLVALPAAETDKGDPE